MIKSLFKKYGKLSFSMINFTSKNSIFPLNQKFFCNLNVDHDFKALNKQIINEENVNKIIDDWTLSADLWRRKRNSFWGILV